MAARRWSLGIIAALVTALGIAAPAGALTITINNPNAGDAFTATVSALVLTASIGTIRCNVTVSGTIADQSFDASVTGAIGAVTAGTASSCTPAVVVPLNNFPWNLTIAPSTVLAGGGLYRININNPDFTVTGVNFIATSLTATTNGSTLNLVQPATVRNVRNAALTGTLGPQNWNFGPSAISITG